MIKFWTFSTRLKKLQVNSVLILSKKAAKEIKSRNKLVWFADPS